MGPCCLQYVINLYVHGQKASHPTQRGGLGCDNVSAVLIRGSASNKFVQISSVPAKIIWFYVGSTILLWGGVEHFSIPLCTICIYVYTDIHICMYVYTGYIYVYICICICIQ